jgi:hypothetical protein
MMEPVDIRGNQLAAERLKTCGKHEIAVMEGLHNQQYAVEQHRLGRKTRTAEQGRLPAYTKASARWWRMVVVTSRSVSE